MILRRVISHFRQQEWTAIAIDFLIVVVGVFVGLQVSNWNEGRAVDQQSALFTERLTADLLEEAWNFQFLVGYYDDVLTHANKALAILEGKSAASDEALLISAYRATQYNEAFRRRATYDELTSTGNIGLIRDQTLRLTAMRIYTAPVFDDLANEGIASRYREAFRMIVPIHVQNALAANCGDRVIITGDFNSIVDALDYDCETGLPPQTIADAAGDLRSDTTLVPYLRLRIANLQTVTGNLTTYNPEIASGLEAVMETTP
jgi:hypothetical protein